MRYNTFVFMSDIQDKDPEEIVVSFIKRDLDRLIVEVLPERKPKTFTTFIDTLQKNEIKFDCFIAAFDYHIPEVQIDKMNHLLKYAGNKGMYRLWLRVNEAPEPQNLDELVNLIYNPIVGHRPLVVLSQIPYFYKPGTLTRALMSSLEPKNVAISPVLKFNLSQPEIDQTNKVLTDLKTSWTLLPTIYYPLASGAIDDEIYDYFHLTLPQITKEVSFLGWKSTSSSEFPKFYEKLKGDLMTKKEKTKLARKSRPKKPELPKYQKVVVLCKHLAKRKYPAQSSESFGNYNQGNIIEVKRIFPDGAGVLFAETVEGCYIYVQDGTRKFVKIL